MSLPDWNDLPAEARKAARDTAFYTHEVREEYAGQCALDIYNAIRERVPPEVFPLFKLVPKNRAAFEAYQIIGALGHFTGTFEHPDVQRALDHFSGVFLDREILPWPREEIKPRVRVRAGRRVL